VRLTIREAVRDLPDRDRKVVYLRYYENLSQSEIAEQIGVSQVHVSRILRACSAGSTGAQGLGPRSSADGDAMQLAAG